MRARPITHTHCADELDNASRLAQVSAAAVPAERPGQLRETLVGRALYIAASYFNHSCEPNCIMTRPFSGQRKRQGGETDACCVSALRDIQVQWLPRVVFMCSAALNLCMQYALG